MSFRGTKYTPILFSTSLLTLSEGGTVIPDMAQMSSPFRRPMLVDEIRFSYISPSGGSQIWSMGNSLRCKLSLGRMAMTHTRDGGGYVPIWNFGPALQTAIYTEGNVDTLFNSVVVTTGHFRWKLPKPLYVPAGQSLMPSLSRQRDGLGGTARVGIAVVGRQFGEANHELPKTIDVPFVTYFEPPGGVGSAITTELDFSNPFLVPLNVQRFVWRPYQQSASARDDGNVVGGGLATCNLTIKDSWGNNVVRDVTDSSSVFDLFRRAWTFTRVLGPKERYVVSFSNILNASGYPTLFSLPNLSMVGWREEVLK